MDCYQHSVRTSPPMGEVKVRQTQLSFNRSIRIAGGDGPPATGEGGRGDRGGPAAPTRPAKKKASDACEPSRARPLASGRTGSPLGGVAGEPSRLFSVLFFTATSPVGSTRSLSALRVDFERTHAGR